ncbi:hypothetical protein AB0F17_17200 [Nonomuraea sp. NPDC026600]|uniref:hypothetical protein n=1 Tax=Nonomuraea sp. NPDC026600 TaxID=3155363 RepID=UPI0033E52015
MGSRWHGLGQHVLDPLALDLLHPALAATSGFVSLRVNAEDKAGGTVTQTVDRAYGLK